MADFPTTEYTPRTMVNRPSAVYDEAKTKVIYAEDFNKINAEIVAIENYILPRMNVEGGLMVQLKNKTGSASVKGEVVRAGTAEDNSVVLCVDTRPDAIGVFYEDDIADGDLAWVVISGIADVYFIGSTTHGHLARTFVASESGYVIGQAKDDTVPTPPFDDDKHFCEIGHILESRSGAGLAKCVLHFN